MTATNLARSLARVLVHEGGWSNHPKDPGGATMKGVTQRAYDLYRKAKKLAARSVKQITTDELQDIYDTRYWDAVKADKLPPGVDYVVFDGAVNSGPVQSVKWLQRALGSHYTGRIDGQPGQSTLAAVEQHPNHDALIRAICERRMIFLRALKGWSTFGRGWAARVDSVSKGGQAWASGDSAPIATFISGGNAKGIVDDANGKPWKAPSDAAIGGGVLTAGVSQAQDQLAPYGDFPIVAKVLFVLTVLGILLAIGGYGWRKYAEWRADKRADALDLNEAAT